MQKDKLEIVLSVLFASTFVLLLMVALFMLFRIYLKRKNKLLLEKERMRSQFEQTLLQSKLEIQEQTFLDISKELHDNVGQVLSLIRLNVNTLNAPGETEKITLIDELLGKALTDIRNLSHTLDADYIRKIGWSGLVQKLMTALQNTGKFTTHLQLDEHLPLLGTEKPIILFRMIQEVIHNVIKHAEANTIYLKAQKENDQLVITISDNGKGFSENQVAGGAGLQNLKNRAKMINAEVTINSRPGMGTLVKISIKTDSID
jgi:signal transduction histidine kinase